MPNDQDTQLVTDTDIEEVSKDSGEFTQDPEIFTREYQGALTLAVNSADEPYVPGPLSRAYHRLTKSERDSINQEVNRIFRQRTGITKKLLDRKADIKPIRQWLRIRDVVVARRFELSGKRHDIDYRWALYQVDLSKNTFEIDVEHRKHAAPVIQPAVTKLIFGRTRLPSGFTLTMKSFDGHDRWRVQWSNAANLAASLTSRFRYVLVFPKNFGPEWRAKHKQERIRRQMGRLKKLISLHTPNTQLGGRTPWEALQLPSGNYEVRGQGFMSVRKDLLYFYPYSDSEKFNEAIRWFLERDVFLPVALSVNERQQRGLLKQALVGALFLMSGGAKLKPFGAPNQAMEAKLKVLAETKAKKTLKDLVDDHRKNQGHPDLFTIAREKVQSTSERDAQAMVDRLAKKPAKKLKVLDPVR